MTQWRIPIALKLFLAVLLTTLLITTISLGFLHWTMQKNFSRYVAQVEMQKLEHLNNNLAEIYQVYGEWNTAIERSFTNILPALNQGEKERLSQRWLRRQYDVAQQQTAILEDPSLFQKRIQDDGFAANYSDYIPSHFEPFVLAQSVAIKSNQDPQKPAQSGATQANSDTSRRWLIPLPDRLGLGNRLSLYDAQKKFVTGDNGSEIPLQAIIVDGKTVGYLGLRPALDVDDALSINFFSNQQRYLFLIFAASVLLSAVVALILATIFRKLIHRVLNGALELSSGNYQHKVKIKSNDEFSDLAQVINQLAQILDQHEQSRRQWVSDTSHELKTPLAVLQAQIEAMQDGVRKATPEHLDRMMKQVFSLKKLTQDLADLAQADAQQLTCYFNKTDPWQIVVHEVENFKSQFEQKNIKLDLHGEGIQLMTDADRFRQVVVNLLSNSLRYTETAGEVRIRTILTADQWCLQIDDSPLGLNDEQLNQLGERFYRVDDSRTRGTGGTGLGLALSKKISQALGGDLQFNHSPLGGLRCTVILNRHQTAKMSD